MGNSKIDPSVIINFIDKYPNDMDLGKKLRAYFLEAYLTDINKGQKEVIKGHTKL